jgi:BCD family chlorophyll transporter-like MFS transporter
MASVLILGVLSRVLHDELGVSLGVVTAVLASYNLAAPIAVGIGHRSDHRPILGKRRTPYIVAGAIVTGLAVAAAPHVAGRLSHGVTPASVILSVLLFVAMGIGMYGAGTVFFALLSDLSTPSERGHTASVVYLELMIGVLCGVALTGAILKNNATNIGTLFGVAGLLVVLLTVIAVWGQEKGTTVAAAAERSAEPRPSLRVAVREIAAMPQARLFFLFMVGSTFFLFLQQGILTSFGADVLHMSVRATSSFSAILTIGTIAGMTVAGRPFAEQVGHRRVAVVGIGLSVIAFAGLAGAAATKAAPPAWLSILFLGFTSGLFNVSSLALMMGMADRRRTALFMGLWTLAHALADGSATAGGGSLFEIFRHGFGSVPGGYASVFAIEAVGLAACIPLLRRVDTGSFASQIDAASAFTAALAESGAVVPIDVPPPEDVAESAPKKAAVQKAKRRAPSKRPAPVTRSRASRAAPASRSSRQRSAAKTRRTRTDAAP